MAAAYVHGSNADRIYSTKKRRTVIKINQNAKPVAAKPEIEELRSRDAGLARMLSPNLFRYPALKGLEPTLAGVSPPYGV